MTINAKNEDGEFKPVGGVSISEVTLVEVCIPSHADDIKNKARSIADFGFHGMWKDRTGIGDGVEYVNKPWRDLRS
jgi:hypothetical protein